MESQIVLNKRNTKQHHMFEQMQDILKQIDNNKSVKQNGGHDKSKLNKIMFHLNNGKKVDDDNTKLQNRHYVKSLKLLNKYKNTYSKNMIGGNHDQINSNHLKFILLQTQIFMYYLKQVYDFFDDKTKFIIKQIGDIFEQLNKFTTIKSDDYKNISDLIDNLRMHVKLCLSFIQKSYVTTILSVKALFENDDFTACVFKILFSNKLFCLKYCENDNLLYGYILQVRKLYAMPRIMLFDMMSGHSLMTHLTQYLFGSFATCNFDRINISKHFVYKLKFALKSMPDYTNSFVPMDTLIVSKIINPYDKDCFYRSISVSLTTSENYDSILKARLIGFLLPMIKLLFKDKFDTKFDESQKQKLDKLMKDKDGLDNKLKTEEQLSYFVDIIDNELVPIIQTHLNSLDDNIVNDLFVTFELDKGVTFSFVDIFVIIVDFFIWRFGSYGHNIGFKYDDHARYHFKILHVLQYHDFAFVSNANQLPYPTEHTLEIPLIDICDCDMEKKCAKDGKHFEVLSDITLSSESEYDKFEKFESFGTSILRLATQPFEYSTKIESTSVALAQPAT